MDFVWVRNGIFLSWEFLDNNDCFAYHRMRLRSDDGDIEKNKYTHTSTNQM